ncbi:MAG: F0F1 ATP synthase subunit B [Alphaproteobacteria bacterium]|mgnify:CR=1 FL=1|nr:F0F1 ATP synthase subunit B [Alphaproteobacteria bacterium]
MTGIFADPTFWVAVGTAIFLGVVVWQRVPQMVAKMLDDRAAGIQAELTEAKRLREEAEAILKEYRAKTANAAQEAQAIIDAAKLSAERMATDARAQLAVQIERRGKMAEQKIAQAEAEAIADVRAAATATAAAAAAEVIGKHMTETKGDALIDTAIRDLRTKLH